MGTRAVASVFMLAHASAVWSVDPLIEAVATYEGVPPRILHAMALAESARWVAGELRPWPWTLNIEGEPHYFKSRQAQFEMLMRALRGGHMSVDIGRMQVNWFWQFDRIASPWRITDPQANYKLAAQIVRGYYDEEGDWWIAVGRYHRPSRRPQDRVIAQQYRERVRRFYNDLDGGAHSAASYSATRGRNGLHRSLGRA